MDALTAVREPSWPRLAASAMVRLGQVMTASVLALLALAALVVVLRRLSGALVEPLPSAVLWCLAAFLAGIAILFRGSFVAHVADQTRARAYALWAAPSVVLLLAAVGLSSRETAGGGLIGLWGLLALEEGWSWSRWFPEAAASRVAQPAAVAPSGIVASPRTLDIASGGDEACDPAVSQRLVRRRQAEGGEILEGWVRAALVAGQRHAAAHVVICPPFARVAECFAEPSDGPPSQVKVAQVLPYGVRFEIKLDAPAEEPTNVTIEFSIHELPSED